MLSTLVMLELDAMGVERVNIGLAAQYIDHNLLETDNRNGDEHLFLRSACPRFGIWYSRRRNRRQILATGNARHTNHRLLLPQIT